MTHDEYACPGAPGPISGLGWVERVVRYAVSRIPAPRLYLGLADSGYAG